METGINEDQFFMNQALKEANIAYSKGEIPIGAVIVSNNKIIARAHNLTETLNDPTAHAEMLAITSATSYLGAKYLVGCTIYVTVEPCPMCAAALSWAKISSIVYGASEPKFGFTTISNKLLHPKTKITKDILNNKCSELMVSFFKSKRK